MPTPAAESELITFLPFHFEVETGRLWSGDQLCALRPQAAAILEYLLRRPGQVVSKAELFSALWPGVSVSAGVLKTYIWEIRKALDHTRGSSQLVETLPRRGYRFIGEVQGPRSKVQGPTSALVATTDFDPLVPSPQSLAANVVGREAELAQLHEWWAQARKGERQVAFVTGEAGIGKTTLVDAFLRQVTSTGEALCIGRGQCIEHYGTGEAYMPVLEALGRLARQSQTLPLVATLHRYAPTVLAQLPALLTEAERERLRFQEQGVTQDRLLRELVDALEALSGSLPLVLCLEDLHWSDASTVELLSALARRQDPARLLVLGTYRPVTLLSPEHPLRATIQELVVRKQCGQIPLDCLAESAVVTYVTHRLGEAVPHLPSVGRLAQEIYQRTEGHPLFVVNVVDDLLANTRQGGQGKTFTAPEDAERLSDLLAVVPDSVRQIIVQQCDRLSREEQHLLAVASLAGEEFSAAAVAAGIADDEQAAQPVRIEEQCTSLARRQLFLRLSREGSPSEQRATERYQFRHSLYRSVMAERVSAGQQQVVHQRLGNWKAAAYGTRADHIAAELALHFSAAHEYQQAIHYSEVAARNALRLGANPEAAQHLTRAVTLLRHLPATDDRDQQELMLLVSLAGPLTASRGYADPAIVVLNTRARQLCEQFNNRPLLFLITVSAWASALVRGPLPDARRLGEEALTLAGELQGPIFFLSAHFALGASLFYVAEFAAARDHLEDCIRRYDPEQHHFLASMYGQDLGVLSYIYLAWVLWHLGAPDQARQRMSEGLALARQLNHSYSLAAVHAFAAWLHYLLREVPAAQAEAEAAMAISTTQGFPFWITAGMICRGWALAEQGQAEEGIAQIRQGLAIHEQTGALVGRPADIALIARIQGEYGDAEQGLVVLEDAFSVLRDTGERAYEAHLYVVKGTLTLQKFQVSGSEFQVPPNPQPLTPSTHAEAEAEACFSKALELARQQQAKAWELRASMSLARLWQQQGKRHEAHALLSGIYGQFSEGFETVDLQEAQALLAVT